MGELVLLLPRPQQELIVATSTDWLTLLSPCSGPDDRSIYVDANTRIQIIETMMDLPTADKEQNAAFIVSVHFRSTCACASLCGDPPPVTNHPSRCISRRDMGKNCIYARFLHATNAAKGYGIVCNLEFGGC